MHVEVRFFAHLRDAVGAERLDFEVDEDSTVGDVLRDLADRHPDLDVLDKSGDLRPHVNVLRNGRNVGYDGGLDTPLSDGDEVGVFPPVEGG
ncbi:MAG TPA: ubiquitin-like small modifier protein 1 [Halobacteriales archaeon]|nr:ubiquitin-like small modifier protein 1 [Halobacteriales archaeon]